VALLLSCIGFIGGGLSGQTPAPAFEAASVKPNPLRTGIRGHSFPGDRFVALNVPLSDLIMVAYGEAGQLRPYSQLAGGPTWMGSNRFDVNATAGSQNGAPTVAEKQLMLRGLLAERFKLAVRLETRTLPIYALVMARKNGALGPQLQRAAVDCEAILASQPGRRDRCILYAVPSGNLMLRGQTMSGLANALAMLLDRPVVDRTELTGGFDAEATFNPEGLPGMTLPPPGPDRPASTAPSLFTALEEQLGLKLESTKGPVDVLVVDHAEPPSED
jgi:uncharacterized protein (TIGR03435 family)